MTTGESIRSTILTNDPLWWRQAAVYQIYPRSFADGNGDGIGDLVGIISRVLYLASLGINAVWLSPFYPSALADGGYDVDDYRNIDPRIGTLAEFDVLVAELHDAGIRVIVDIVPNHSSNLHAWFQEAIVSPKGSEARNRYIFRDGKGKNGELPPNTWTSVFGGSAWQQITEPDGSPGQWYFHYFATEQPDFNWDNREVQEDFLKTLRFWSDRGVDGFRVDVASMLKKNLDPAYDGLVDLDRLGQSLFHDGLHPIFDRDEVHDIYREWRQVFNEYDPPRMAVAEAWIPSHRLAPYASTEELGQAFNFDLLRSRFDADSFKAIIAANLTLSAETGASSTWVFSNHDVVRHPTRYGLPEYAQAGSSFRIGAEWLKNGGLPDEIDVAGGLRRGTAATLLMLGLPGSAYIYQGEELGLHEVGDIPADQRQDPIFFRTNGSEIGRDGCRVPLPWEPTGTSFGFGSDGTHLPQPAWFADYAVSVEDDDKDSTLNLYRKALSLRAELQGAEQLEWLDAPEGVLHFARPGGWQVITNFTGNPIALPAGEVLMTSSPLVGDMLAGESTAWIRA
ncbi:MAG: glycoside hydrolase family 13 protein [Thermomicrobiales bacterium]|nr:glycoside hydrolase family 13 protein [Thermomicrobiales bacterium]MCO5219155.1 glycoside hydrolase family 13 protein [Thermomicrobiales bacterium]MCO5226289.1 glycoside hydrolase family 13 protein [Thermomicrobiales bacterium]MCO5228971.1 glycoside hydrolase family 13 protein [Thermomicrobiales bacterium]